jgi:ABC-2 type transport system permease protein
MMRAGTGMNFSLNRVAAMVRRYWYLLRSSWPRILDLIYWPTVQMLMWGFLQVYISQNSGFFARAGGVFIGSVLLWDILFRGQLGFSISFLEEMYARNLGNLMMSPLRPAEFLLALMIMSLVRLSIGMIPVSILAIVFFGFNLWALGLALAAFFCEPDFDQLVGRRFCRRAIASKRPRRGKHGLDDHVSVSAANLRLLSG